MKMQEPLGGQAVGNMLYGMQSLSSDVPEVCVLLSDSCIAGQLQAAEGAQEVGNMYGMQGMRWCLGGAFSAGYASHCWAATGPLKEEMAIIDMLVCRGMSE
jgi:hypothetical protein